MTENAMSEVDIAVNWIKYPETVSVGEYIEVVWMGTNVGSKKIQGNCKTTLSLVNESTAEELELGQITNLINLTPSESDEFSAKIKIPQTVRDGAWRIKIVANSNRGIFEGRNTGNNTVTGEALINVEMPVFEGNSITIGANSSATAKFAAAESTRCVLITAPEGMKIYGGSGYVPNAQIHSSEATNCGNGVYVLAIPASSESFYLSFVNESANIKTANIEITENSLAVFGTSINELPNNGQVTFSVYGSGFSDKSVVTVVGDGVKLPVAGIKYVSPNELSVTLAPEYAQAGEYELAVNDGISGAACGKNLTVLQTSKGPVLETETVLPNGARAGRTFAFTVKCRNAGDANLAIPMVALRDTGDAGLEFSLDGENFKTGEIKFLSLDNNGGFDAIEAGKEAITTVYCRVPSTANEVKISTRANTPNDVMAKYTNEVDSTIDSYIAYLGALDGNSEISRNISEQKNILGPTNGEYISKLSSLANDILTNGGRVQNDVESLTRILLLDEPITDVEYDEITSEATFNLLLTSASSDDDSITGDSKVKIWCYDGRFNKMTSKDKGIFSGQNKFIIVSHGWNAELSDIKPIARAAYNATGIKVLCIEWDEYAHSRWYNSLILQDIEASSVAAYIPWVVNKAIEGLNILGIRDGSNSIFIGHSHGAHLTGHMANRLGAMLHVGLDTSIESAHRNNAGSLFTPGGKIKKTIFFRSTPTCGRDTPYANENYVISQNYDFFEDGAWRRGSDTVVSFTKKRHGWAKDWFVSNVLNKNLLLKLITNSYLSIVHPEMDDVKVSRGMFFGVFNDTNSSFATSYPINYNSYNDKKKYHIFPISSSWDGFVEALSKSVDLTIANYNPNLEWYTGKKYSVRELPQKIIDVSDTDVLYGLKSVQRINTNIRIYDPNSGFEYLNYTESYFKDIISNVYYLYYWNNESSGFSLTWPNDTDNADDVEHDVKIEISFMPENGIEIWSPNNTITFDGKVINSKAPVAKINGEYKDGFILSKKFEYTQERYDSLKSSGDTTTSFKLNGDADLSPEKNPIKSWFWHNQDETQDTSIEISKVDSGRYPVALIVKDSAGKYDSVSGFVEVKVFVDGEEEEAPLPESRDPNEMSGPAGVGKDRKVLPGQWLDFKIYFENAPTATAAAQEIHIESMLSEYLDWNTFALGEIVFKNQIATSLSGKNSGSAEVALADGSQNVRMEFSLDSSTGRAYWYMRSVDPSTADGWPVDPYAGFLPPNDGKGNGEGYVAYRIRVRDDAPRTR